jgi:hypothetical protein
LGICCPCDWQQPVPTGNTDESTNLDRMGRSRAVIYVSRAQSTTATRRCLNHCIERDYEVASVVLEGENTERWRDAFGAVASGLADVIIVTGLDLPVEIAGDHRPDRPQGPTAGQRRPRRLT